MIRTLLMVTVLGLSLNAFAGKAAPKKAAAPAAATTAAATSTAKDECLKENPALKDAELDACVKAKEHKTK